MANKPKPKAAAKAADKPRMNVAPTGPVNKKLAEKPAPAPAPAKTAKPVPTAASSGGAKSSIVDASYRERYVISDTKTPGGRKTINNGDKVAKAIEGKTADEVIQFVVANGGEPGKWDHLNVGMQRMSAGNALRGLLRANGKLKIGNVTIISDEPVPEKKSAKAETRKAA